MGKTAESRRIGGFDQQVQLPSSGMELRKGGNVLPTSSPKAPVPNPFVQAQTSGSNLDKNSVKSSSAGNKK